MPKCYHSSASCNNLHLSFSYYLYNHVNQLYVLTTSIRHSPLFGALWIMICWYWHITSITQLFLKEEFTSFFLRLLHILLTFVQVMIILTEIGNILWFLTLHLCCSKICLQLPPFTWSPFWSTYPLKESPLHPTDPLMLPHHQQNELNLRNITVSNVSFWCSKQFCSISL